VRRCTAVATISSAAFGSGGPQLLGHAQGGGFGPRQIVEQHGNVVPGGLRRAIEGDAVLRQFVGARIKLARNSAKLARGLVAKLHQMLGHHCQFGPAVLDPLCQDREETFQRPRLGPHFNDRAGEALGFLPPGAAEHDPDESKQRQRPSSERQPLGNGRRRKRLAGQRLARRPCDVAEP
jgi:hypothetical protein